VTDLQEEYTSRTTKAVPQIRFSYADLVANHNSKANANANAVSQGVLKNLSKSLIEAEFLEKLKEDINRRPLEKLNIDSTTTLLRA